MKAAGLKPAGLKAARKSRAAAVESSERPLTLALPRGRILDEAVAVFARAGIDIGAAEKARAGRRLIIPIPEHGLKVLIVRDTDVPAYVEHGAADFGIAGRDVLEEQGCDLYEPLDLGIGRCRMVVAEPEDRPVDETAQVHLRYATKFPEITRRHLQARGTVAEIIKLYGSIEIAPLVGLADRIVDLVSSGETLRQHHLREVETILEVSARVCVGRASAKLYGDGSTRSSLVCDTSSTAPERHSALAAKGSAATPPPGASEAARCHTILPTQPCGGTEQATTVSAVRRLPASRSSMVPACAS